MKKGLFFLTVSYVSFSVLFSSCGPPIRGKMVNVNRDVTTFFNSVDIGAPVNCKITVQQGAQTSIQLSGPENFMKMLTTRVQDSVLHIESNDDFRIDWDDLVTVTITTPVLNSLDMSGAGSADVMGNVTGSRFNADVSGVGKLTFTNITVDSLNIAMSGAGTLKIKAGNVKYGIYDLSGAGSIEAYGLQNDEANASVSGAGGIRLSANTKLTTSISGVGSIRYKGHPAITSENSGVGSVKNAN